MGPVSPIALVLFGSPGSGKGTQSKYLTAWLGIPQISTGEMLREHVRAGDKIGQAVSSLLKAGSLVPDALVNEMVRQRIGRQDCARGFILDGYPRTTAQAVEMEGLLADARASEVVIHLAVDYNVIISRITGRRVCPVCGTVYNAKSNPPKIEGVCDLDGNQLAVRNDDREDVVRERLSQYERQTRPLIEFFNGGGHRFITVDASRETPENVFRKIQSELAGSGLVADLAGAVK
ncbi:MAG TPA: nucleoside monophosphate kinase [Bryobacteraceae bacterium]|nr:nucleoside monophosphate kinase [Bryobacteraceae bacterium]